MSYVPHDLSNLKSPEQYLNKLPLDDISKKYFSGEKYESTFTNRLKIIFATGSILSELKKFYPYHPIINKTN